MTEKKTTSGKKTSKPGLYANIHKAQARAAAGGRPVRKKDEAGAPTEDAFREAAKTEKKGTAKQASKSTGTKSKTSVKKT